MGPFGSNLDGPEQRKLYRGAGNSQAGGLREQTANRRELLDRAAKSELVSGPWRGFQGHQGRRRRSLFRPDGRPDADSAPADEAGRGEREGREEPAGQDRSGRQRGRFHRSASEGADADRLLGRSGGGAEGGGRFRQDERAFRHSWRSDGQDRARSERGQGARRACPRSTSCGRRSSASSRRRRPRSRRS